MRQPVKLYISFIITILFSTVSLAQANKEDSLKKIAGRDVVDTNVIDANKQLSFMFQEGKPDVAIGYSRIALEKSKILKDSFRIAQSYKSIGIAYDIKGNMDSALWYLNQALSLFKIINRPDYQSHTLTDKAMAYYYKGNYELALRNHLAALELRKKLGNDKHIAHSYNNIGLVYRSRKDYRNAVKFYKQSYRLKESINDENGMLNSLINVGAAFQTNGQFDSAYHYGIRSLQLAKKINSTEDISASKENIAASLVNLKRPDEAMKYLEETDKDSALLQNKRQLITHSETYGDMYLQKNDMPSAMKHYQIGLQAAKSNNRLEAMEVFYRKLSRAFYRQGKYLDAYDFLDLSKSISDTLLNTENSRQVNEMSAIYETAEK